MDIPIYPLARLARVKTDHKAPATDARIAYTRYCQALLLPRWILRWMYDKGDLDMDSQCDAVISVPHTFCFHCAISEDACMHIWF